MKLLTCPVVMILCLFCSGCGDTWPPNYELISADKLHQLVDSSRKDMVSTWLYYGTDESHHYFSRQFIPTIWFEFFGTPQGFFEINKAELAMPNTFPPTQNCDYPNARSRSVFTKMEKRMDDQGQLKWYTVFDFNDRK